MSRLTETRRYAYERMFELATIRPERAREVERWCDRVLELKPRYLAIGQPLGVPWHFIAAVHMRETSLRTDRHLHNGDPLTARTVRVPAGRPVDGAPPFSFEQSANDALRLKKLDAWSDWSLAGTLYQLERYNGFGYDLRNLPSPYLWSFTQHYERGKFIKDGVYDPLAVDAQCGVAALLRRLAERQEIRFGDEPSVDSNPLVVSYAKARPTRPEIIEAARKLQEWLNTFPGIHLRVDGWPSERTSNAFLMVTGRYLPGDPRSA